MASTFDIRGTSLDSFRLGKNGPTLNRSGSDINIGSNKIITSADLPSSTILQTKTAEVGTQVFYSMPSSSSVSQLFNVNITPASISNKILIRVNISGLDIVGGTLFKVILRRNSTTILERRIDCSLSTAYDSLVYDFLDTPATTSAIDYDIVIGSTATSNLYVNRQSSSTDPQGYSSLTVMEIGSGSAGGGGRLAFTTVSSNYTITNSNEYISVNANSTAITITLPAASGVGSGYVIRIKKVDSSANTVTITPNGAQTVEGSSSVVLTTQYQMLSIISDGSNWLRLS